MNIVVSLTTYTSTSPALSLHQVLRKLLASKNPDDLRAANRLIREMVRRVSWDGGWDNACVLVSWLAGKVAGTVSVCWYTPIGIVITPPCHNVYTSHGVYTFKFRNFGWVSSEASRVSCMALVKYSIEFSGAQWSCFLLNSHTHSTTRLIHWPLPRFGLACSLNLHVRVVLSHTPLAMQVS